MIEINNTLGVIVKLNALIALGVIRTQGFITKLVRLSPRVIITSRLLITHRALIYFNNEKIKVDINKYSISPSVCYYHTGQ